MIALSTLAIWAGTVGTALCGLLLVLLVVKVAQHVLPHDPPPIQDGETIASRIGRLHW